MTHPVLHIDPIKLALSHVHRQRMTENMHVLPVLREPRCLRVLAKRIGHERCRNRLADPLPAREEVTCPRGAGLPKIVLEQLLC